MVDNQVIYDYYKILFPGESGFFHRNHDITGQDMMESYDLCLNLQLVD